MKRRQRRLPAVESGEAYFRMNTRVPRHPCPPYHSTPIGDSWEGGLDK